MGKQGSIKTESTVKKEAHLHIKDESIQSDVGMVHLVFKLERLRDQELEREDVGRFRVGDPRRELVDRGRAVFRLGREEDAGEPAWGEGGCVIFPERRRERNGVNALITQREIPDARNRVDEAGRARRAHSHDILGVVVHAGVSEVEPFEVSHGGGGDDFGVLEGAAQGCDLGEVVGDEGLLVGDGQVLDLGGRWGRRVRRRSRGRRLRW